MSPADSGLLTLLETVLGPVWVWVFIGEVPHRGAIVGGGVVVTAIAVSCILAMRTSEASSLTSEAFSALGLEPEPS